MRLTHTAVTLFSLFSVLFATTGCADNRYKVKDQMVTGVVATKAPSSVSSSDHRSIDSGLSTQYISSDGRKRKYLVYIPRSYNPTRPTPLVIGLHAGMSNPENFMERTRFATLADRENFIAIFPQGSAFRERKGRFVWNAGVCCGYAAKRNIDDVGFIRQLIGEMETRYTIDSKRIFATGFSNGGGMSYRLACDLSDKIVGIAVVSSSLDDRSCSLKKSVNVIHIHGTADQNNPYYGGTTAKSLSKTVKVSTQESLDVMISQNHCNKTPKIRTRDDLTYIDYSCQGSSRVSHIKIDKGEHAWPGSTFVSTAKNHPSQKTTRNLDASEVIWAFFNTTSQP